jgi:septal ring-binding cell division protein DamX
VNGAVARKARSYILAAAVPALAAADYQTGLDAFSLGDYASAMTEWRAVTDGPATAVNPAIYVEAHYAVAMLYWQGQGVAQDYGRAREWLLKAARMNHAGAQAKLGYMYTDGVTVPQDYGQALEWFQQAARGGNVDGLYNLGIFYLYGWGVEQDATLAAQYLAAASAQGDPEAEEALQRVLVQIREEAPSRVPALEELPEPAAAPDEAPVGARFARDPGPTPDEAPVGARVARDSYATPLTVAPTDAEPVSGASAGADLSRAKRAPTAEIPIESEPVLLDEEWIRAQNPQHYTIQVMALRSRDKVQEFMEDYKAFAPFAVFTVQKGSAPLHVMLQGSYPDVASARAAKARFPRQIQQQDALWIRRFEMVQRLLE